MTTSRRLVRGTLPRSGFTLIEMLVAVTLVTLMMTLFASVFQVATDLMGRQKGVAENDQRARMVCTLLHNDLKNRTFLEVAPWGAGESTGGGSNLNNRKGYFCISENDPVNDSDDVLSFTIQIPNTNDKLFGRAHALADGGGNVNATNQPEHDDERTDANETGSSVWAEVVYFVRNGVLYRRVMLVRDQVDGTPRDASAVALVTTPYETGGATRNIWTDFDYSIHFDPITSKPSFHGTNELNNNIGSIPTSTNVPSLGIPHYRFGFNHATGLPREFVGTTFIGRYLQQETSSPSFGYPGRVTAPSPNPMDPGTTRTINANGIVTEYADGTRVADDMLLANVHAFDVKVWDPAASYGPNNVDDLGAPGTDDGAYVDVGHSGTRGFYRASANQNTAYGNTFDTWHPNCDLPSGGAAQDLPPFRPATNATLKFVRNPLRAIQIKIRFFDVTSGQLREVTWLEPLSF